MHRICIKSREEKIVVNYNDLRCKNYIYKVYRRAVLYIFFIHTSLYSSNCEALFIQIVYILANLAKKKKDFSKAFVNLKVVVRLW